jgi:hypothetical protein
MPTDLASIAAAITAGYKEIVADRGASWLPASARFEVTLEKHLTGQSGNSGAPVRAYGVGASQATAETQALAALNGQRSHRYGFAAAGGSQGSAGGSLSVDAH